MGREETAENELRKLTRQLDEAYGKTADNLTNNAQVRVENEHNEQTRIPLALRWGGGEVASADRLRFVVPIRTLNAGPNSKYFPVGRGITYWTRGRI